MYADTFSMRSSPLPQGFRNPPQLQWRYLDHRADPLSYSSAASLYCSSVRKTHQTQQHGHRGDEDDYCSRSRWKWNPSTPNILLTWGGLHASATSCRWNRRLLRLSATNLQGGSGTVSSTRSGDIDRHPMWLLT